MSLYQPARKPALLKPKHVLPTHNQIYRTQHDGPYACANAKLRQATNLPVAALIKLQISPARGRNSLSVCARARTCATSALRRHNLTGSVDQTNRFNWFDQPKRFVEKLSQHALVSVVFGLAVARQVVQQLHQRPQSGLGGVGHAAVRGAVVVDHCAAGCGEFRNSVQC